MKKHKDWWALYLWAGDKVLGEGGRKQAGQHFFHPGAELDVQQLSPGTGLSHAARPTRIHDTLGQAGQDLVQLVWNDWKGVWNPFKRVSVTSPVLLRALRMLCLLSSLEFGDLKLPVWAQGHSTVVKNTHLSDPHTWHAPSGYRCHTASSDCHSHCPHSTWSRLDSSCLTKKKKKTHFKEVGLMFMEAGNRIQSCSSPRS